MLSSISSRRNTDQLLRRRRRKRRSCFTKACSFYKDVVGNEDQNNIDLYTSYNATNNDTKCLLNSNAVHITMGIETPKDLRIDTSVNVDEDWDDAFKVTKFQSALTPYSESSTQAVIDPHKLSITPLSADADFLQEPFPVLEEKITSKTLKDETAVHHAEKSSQDDNNEMTPPMEISYFEIVWPPLSNMDQNKKDCPERNVSFTEDTLSSSSSSDQILEDENSADSVVLTPTAKKNPTTSQTTPSTQGSSECGIFYKMNSLGMNEYETSRYFGSTHETCNLSDNLVPSEFTDFQEGKKTPEDLSAPAPISTPGEKKSAVTYVVSPASDMSDISVEWSIHSFSDDSFNREAFSYCTSEQPIPSNGEIENDKLLYRIDEHTNCPPSNCENSILLDDSDISIKLPLDNQSSIPSLEISTSHTSTIVPFDGENDGENYVQREESNYHIPIIEALFDLTSYHLQIVESMYNFEKCQRPSNCQENRGSTLYNDKAVSMILFLENNNTPLPTKKNVNDTSAVVSDDEDSLENGESQLRLSSPSSESSMNEISAIISDDDDSIENDNENRNVQTENAKSLFRIDEEISSPYLPNNKCNTSTSTEIATSMICEDDKKLFTPERTPELRAQDDNKANQSLLSRNSLGECSPGIIWDRYF